MLIMYVSVCPLFSFWTNVPIFTKLGRDIMSNEVTATSYSFVSYNPQKQYDERRTLWGTNNRAT
jgi:hypothetical protein